jgi:hypothetical protein
MAGLLVDVTTAVQVPLHRPARRSTLLAKDPNGEAPDVR